MRKIITILLVMLSIVGLSSCLGGVEFELNFVVDSETYDTVSTNGKEIVKMPSDPTKDGYIFDGWYWDQDEWNKPFTSNSLLDAPISSNMSVYAKWHVNEQDHVHTPSDWIEDVAATCKAVGSKHKECTECEAVLETIEIEKLTTHTPADAVKEDFVDSTCEAAGSYNSVVYCSVCGENILSEAKTVEKKAHTPSGWIEDTPATCKSEGSKHKECTECEEVLETEEIEKLTTHTYTNDMDIDCNVCGEISCQHNNTTIIPGKSASCSENGLTDGLFCNDCKQTVVAQTVIPASHKEIIIPRIDPECNQCGWTEGKECELCYKVIAEPEMIRPLGCKGGDWVIKVAATEYCSGAKVKYCTRCGEQMQFENIPATVVGLNAEHSVDNDGNTYITILNAYGNLTQTTLNIPDTLWGFSVGAIADEAFAGYSNITKVVIPDSVTSIGSGAFRDCTSLKTVIIGENVNYIGAHAFTRCPLSSITFKNPNGWWMSTSSTTTSGKTISSSVVGDGVSMCKYLSVSYDDYYYRRR
ncbi:MAG: leucine-rich repeat protein [Clostridia bacterium]|nr:leucine-rich repeat protein [Clostridia bacterium]